MKLFTNKKAQHEIMFIIFQLVLIATIGLTLFSYVYKLSADTFHEKDFLTKDLALTTSTILAVPGNIHYTYSLDWSTPNFDYFIENQKIIIQEEIKGTIAYTQFPYADDKMFQTYSKISTTPSQIEFENSGTQLTVKDKITKNLNKLKYPYIDTRTNWQNKEIALLSGILTNPLTGEEYIEDKSFTALIKVDLNHPKTTVSTNSKLVTSPEERFSVASKTKADLIVLFNNNPTEKDSFKIYIPSNPDVIKQSRKLASMIINSLLDKEQFQEINPLIIPLESDIQTVYINLEIGDSILQQSASDIYQVVPEAIKNYYT